MFTDSLDRFNPQDLPALFHILYFSNKRSVLKIKRFYRLQLLRIVNYYYSIIYNRFSD